MTRESLRKHYARIMKAFEFTPDREIYQSSKMIIDLLDKTEWIPVTERLPEDGQYVIVSFSCDAFDLSHKRVMTAWYNKKYGFTCGITDAWMPLPEPYKGGE